MTKVQKIELINNLRIERLKLLDESKKKRAKKSPKRKKKVLQFKSDKLKEIFNNLDSESLKYLMR
jgi:hypothetical protein